MKLEWIFGLAAFFSATLISLLCGRLVLIIANKGIGLDDPALRKEEAHRKVHATPKPRIGGLGVFASFTIVSLLFFYDAAYLPFLLLALGAFSIGFWDDIFTLRASVRLVLQVLLAVASIYVLKIEVPVLNIAPFTPFSLPAPVGWALCVFFIVGAINSINMIDGLDGLLGGVLCISLILLSFVYYLSTQATQIPLMLALPLLGGLIGFLRYNQFPAKMFLGDGGAYFLGYVIAIFMLSILGDVGGLGMPKTGTHSPHFQPVILSLSVPIFDSLSVILSRLKLGKNPFRADKRHFHHGLLRLGFSHANTVTLICFISLIIGICGIIPLAYPAYNLYWVYYVIPLIILGTFFLSHRLNSELVRQVVFYKTLTFKKYGVLSSIAIRLLDGLTNSIIYAILLAAPLFAGRIQYEFAIYAGIILTVIILQKLFRKNNSDAFATTPVLLGIFLILIAINQSPLSIRSGKELISVQVYYNLLFYALVPLFLLQSIFSFRRKYLIVNALDFLVIGIPILILLLPENIVSQYKLNVVGLRALVLLPIISWFAKKSKYSFEKIEMVTVFSLVFVLLFAFFNVRLLID